MRRTAIAVTLAAASGVVLAAASQPAPSRSVWDGVYTAAQAERGAFVYGRYCQRCHGADLSGPGAMGGGLPGQSPAPALVGGEFNYRWHELSVAELVQRIRVSMPPGNPAALSRPDSTDVLAYMLDRGGFPAGEHELPIGLPELSTIAFLAARP